MSRRYWLMGSASLLTIATVLPPLEFDPRVQWESIPDPGKKPQRGMCKFSEMPKTRAGYFRLLPEQVAA
jgi:hypothetical protein